MRPIHVVSLALGAVTLLAAAPPPKPPRFDRASWVSDYEDLKRALERSYSHLRWFGSPESGVDLPALDRRTKDALARATTEQEATAAFDAFIGAFHDGHLIRKPSASAPVPPLPEPAKVTSFVDGPTACAALGYLPSTRVSFSLPFESLPGFTLVTDGLSEAFRSGVIDVGGTRVGVVRIPRFRAGEFPAVCLQAFTRARGGRDAGVSTEELGRGVDAAWLDALARRLELFRKRGVKVVVVDLGGNGGGNDLGDWAVRAFTPAPIQSASLLVVASDAGTPYLEKELADLNAALASDAGWNAPTRAVLERERTAFEVRLGAAREPCDLGWVWKERRPWAQAGCRRLVEAAYFSGPLGHLDAGVLDARAADTLFWATAAEPVRGAWSGPVWVLTDEKTASSAEAFTTLMRDRGVARVIGAHTLGAGCGFMNDVESIVLPRTKLTFGAPNCVRLRDDGTDDVAGVTPDVPVLPLPGESGRARAWRALELLVDGGT
ncbi:MAG: S41 family peptidase [Myxococcaceae bacterium]